MLIFIILCTSAATGFIKHSTLYSGVLIQSDPTHGFGVKALEQPWSVLQRKRRKQKSGGSHHRDIRCTWYHSCTRIIASNNYYTKKDNGTTVTANTKHDHGICVAYRKFLKCLQVTEPQLGCLDNDILSYQAQYSVICDNITTMTEVEMNACQHKVDKTLSMQESEIHTPAPSYLLLELDRNNINLQWVFFHLPVNDSKSSESYNIRIKHLCAVYNIHKYNVALYLDVCGERVADIWLLIYNYHLTAMAKAYSHISWSPDICKERKLPHTFLNWKSYFDWLKMPTLIACHQYNVAVHAMYCFTMVYSNSGPFSDEDHILSGVCKNQPLLHKCWDEMAITCPRNLTQFITDVKNIHAQVCALYKSFKYVATCPLAQQVASHITQNVTCKISTAFVTNVMLRIMQDVLMDERPRDLSSWLQGGPIPINMGTLWRCLINSLQGIIRQGGCKEATDLLTSLIHFMTLAEKNVQYLNVFFWDYYRMLTLDFRSIFIKVIKITFSYLYALISLN